MSSTQRKLDEAKAGPLVGPREQIEDIAKIMGWKVEPVEPTIPRDSEAK